jgi:para-nitrobenzyl esterase
MVSFARRVFSSLLAGIALASAGACTPTSIGEAGPVVAVESGRIAGTRENGLDVYRGVPYAAPPLRDLRWRPPQPAPASENVREADGFAPACIQSGLSMPGEIPPATSEDCLYLNIWAPTDARDVPVLVWIHGGAYRNGSASMPLYWGDELARKGIVVVSVAYRLGPLGFLAHPELSAENDDASSGNYGLMDQIAALQWVKRNIAAFGGNPEAVTIAGQSSGATSVNLLMASPAARNLFHRAIGQSGGMFEPLQLAPGYALENAEREGAAYALELGASSLVELRALPAERLLESRPRSGWHPVIDQAILPRAPYSVFAAGEQNRAALLVGYNADEAGSLADLSSVRAETYGEDIARAWGRLPAPLIDAYPHATDTEGRAARAGFERDLRFGWNITTWARLAAASGDEPVYLYYFAHEPPFPPGSPYEGWGAAHFAELWYMSGHLEQEAWAWTAADRRLGQHMAGYWVNFVKTGDPNQSTLTAWPKFSPSGRQALYLGREIEAGPTPNAEPLAVFDAVYEQVRAQ